MFTGARVYDVVAIVTIVLMAVVTTVAVDAIYGAAIVGVSGWDCSKSGVKLQQQHHPHNYTQWMTTQRQH